MIQSYSFFFSDSLAPVHTCISRYCGGLVTVDSKTEGSLWRAFGEWGTPRKINIVSRLNIAFITYESRLNAEFAKVAMAGQTLEGKSLLNLRWAYEDPNPKAKAERDDEIVDSILTAAEKRGIFESEPCKSDTANDTIKRQRLESAMLTQTIPHISSNVTTSLKTSSDSDLSETTLKRQVTETIGPLSKDMLQKREQEQQAADSILALERALSKADGAAT